MTSAPNLRDLRRLARDRGLVIIRSRQSDPDAADFGLYAIVKPDNGGKGTDPRGERAAEGAFADGHGLTLEDVDDILHGRH